MKEYTCVCGRQFNNSQSFNAHKKSCVAHHLQKYGNLEKYSSYIKDVVQKAAETIRSKHAAKRRKKEIEWEEERHTCEKCGEIMIKKFGTGRFCSRKCANSRKQTKEINYKRSYTRIKKSNPQLSEKEIDKIILGNMQKAADNMQKAAERKKPKPKVDNLPQIAQPPKSQGYQNRKNVPYSELFWKKVLDNNHIPYEVNVPISKPGLNNYYLDFLIYGKIDLEIDGSLHERPDVKKKDIVRTAYLIEKGFIVYRIAWINPNTLPHKILVSQQIENLLKFLEENK